MQVQESIRKGSMHLHNNTLAHGTVTNNNNENDDVGLHELFMLGPTTKGIGILLFD